MPQSMDTQIRSDKAVPGAAQFNKAHSPTVSVNYYKIYKEMAAEKQERERKELMRLWAVYQEELHGEVTNGRLASSGNNNHSLETIPELSDLMERTTLKDEPISKRAAMIARAHAAKDSSLVSSKSKTEARAALIKAKSAPKKPVTASKPETALEKFRRLRAEAEAYHQVLEAKANAELATGQPIQVESTTDLNHRLLRKLPRSEYNSLPASFSNMTEEQKAEVLLAATNSVLEVPLQGNEYRTSISEHQELGGRLEVSCLLATHIMN
jgi:hypothetical protein